MKCVECKQELHVIAGGTKSEEGTTEITTVHVFGCLNKKCSMAMKEQQRTETTNSSFTE